MNEDDLLEDLERQKEELQRKKCEAIQRQEFHEAADLRNEEYKIADKIREIRRRKSEASSPSLHSPEPRELDPQKIGPDVLGSGRDRMSRLESKVADLEERLRRLEDDGKQSRRKRSSRS